MVNAKKLRGIIAENGKTQADVANMIGITPKTFYNRMQRGVFGSNEIQIMIDRLNIANPMDIFLLKSNLKSYRKGEHERNTESGFRHADSISKRTSQSLKYWYEVYNMV